jgi:hypothetical protein
LVCYFAPHDYVIGWSKAMGCNPTLLTFRAAESAHAIDNKAYEQNQAQPAAADDRTAKVKPTATEQEKQNNHK